MRGEGWGEGWGEGEGCGCSSSIAWALSLLTLPAIGSAERSPSCSVCTRSGCWNVIVACFTPALFSRKDSGCVACDGKERHGVSARACGVHPLHSHTHRDALKELFAVLARDANKAVGVGAPTGSKGRGKGGEPHTSTCARTHTHTLHCRTSSLLRP